MTAARPARPVVVLISGRGTNMEAIVHACRGPGSSAKVCAVVSDKAAAAGLERAAALGVRAFCIPPTDYADRAAYDEALAASIDEFAPAVIALAGFMRILGPAFVERYHGRLLNVHPSLLPKYRGLDTHRRALAAGDSEHGASVHFVTEELDAGPLIIQARVPVLPGDSVDTLSARVQAAEHRIYPEAVQLVAAQRVELREGRTCLDGEPLTAPLSIDVLEAQQP